MKWTAEDTKKACDLYATGSSAMDVAKALDRSRNSVLGLLHRSGALRKHSQVASGPLAQRLRTRSKPKDDRDAAMVALLQDKVAECAPNPQPIIIRRDGKIWANDELTNQCCRWPIDDGSKFHFCGASKVPGTSYCEHHVKRAFHVVPTLAKVDEKEKVMA